MMELKLAVAISHTPWIPERVLSMKRLKSQLGIIGECDGVIFDNEILPNDVDGWYFEMTDRAPNHVWSERMWTWATECGDATHAVFLQDDVTVGADFWKRLQAMISAAPDQIIGLEAAHPMCANLLRAGARWCTTTDGLIGVGYVMPIRVLKEFLAWRATKLLPKALEQISEDTLIDVFAMHTKRKIWHPVPTIIDHDIELKSTYGNDNHTNRRPTATWADFAKLGGDVGRLARPEFWTQDTPPPHLGRFYATSFQLLRAVTGIDQAEIDEVERDTGDPLFARGIRLPTASRFRIVIATPVLGADVSTLYHTSVYRLGHAVKDADFSLIVEYDREGHKVGLGHSIDSMWIAARDLVRARSRFVRRFLRTNGTHLLFIDSDVSFTIEAIAGLVSAKKDFVGAPYPRKELDWNRIRKAVALGKDPERFGSGYPYQLSTKIPVTDSALVPVDAIGLGLTLLSRECLEKMEKAYAETLTFLDDAPGEGYAPTVALFQLIINEKQQLLSEDYSFCKRWRDLGGQVLMYVGPGAPIDHVGGHVFRGFREAMYSSKDSDG